MIMVARVLGTNQAWVRFPQLALRFRMIEYAKGDIFSIPADVRVCTVNCVGVMGKGVALAFKQRYPQLFKSYKEQCDLQLWKPGFISLYTLNDKEFALLVATKNHWRNDSELDWVKSSIVKMVARLEQIERNLVIVVPPMGCGNGNLNWADVKPVMQEHFASSRHKFIILEP